MLFNLIAVLGSWCFSHRRDDDIPTGKAFKKSHTFIYIYVRLCSHMVLAFTSQIAPINCTHNLQKKIDKKKSKKKKKKKGVLGKVLSLGVVQSVELGDVC